MGFGLFSDALAVSFRCKGTFWANLGVHDFVGELLKVGKVRELKVLDFLGGGLIDVDSDVGINPPNLTARPRN